ncbi:MAG: aminoglycoside phosphotransferase (APT) family kinase protein [Myxococcota bacterium]|jgi:aminoglycoside phosphotransferase (APT) family kinase protein
MEDQIRAWLAEQSGGTVEVTGVRPLAGGACQDNFVIETIRDGEPGRLVLRSDATSSLPGSLSRHEEYAIIQAAVAAGVPTPAVIGLREGLVRPGAWGYFMDWADGVAIGAKVVRSLSLAEARAVLPEQLAAAAAAIHRITPSTNPRLSIPTIAPDGDVIGEMLAFQRASMADIPEAHPALSLAMRWLEEKRPTSSEVVLVHGDFRVGNFLVDPTGLTAVLDWEFAHWGNPMEDLAWLCVRDWRFGRIDNPVGGLCGRGRFYRAYEAASGRTVDPSLVHYFEVLGNLRWAIGAVVQGLRYLRGGEADLELLAIARRSAEMEYEALRLIEVGPPAV